MENCDKKEECCKEKSCCMSMGKCGMYGKKHCLVKMILKIVIIILIFWCGYKLGLITGFIKAELGSGFNRGGFEMMKGDNYIKNVPNQNNTVPVAPKQ